MSISVRMQTLVPPDSLLTRKNTKIQGLRVRKTHFCDSSAQNGHIPLELLTIRVETAKQLSGT
jgi:hypothetical protein